MEESVNKPTLNEEQVVRLKELKSKFTNEEWVKIERNFDWGEKYNFEACIIKSEFYPSKLIESSFYWGQSPEGHEYWEQVFDRVRK